MLFLKETKKIVLSIPFFLFLFSVIFLLKTQGVLRFSASDVITMPKPGETYGMQNKELPEIIMPAAIARLLMEFETNSYTAYPIGFYKTVRLEEEEQKQMADILAELTETEHMPYEQFKACMHAADALIGGGSYYSDTRLVSTFGKVPVTYEEALAEYEWNKNTDHFTGAYARLFCDYIEILLSILPVFLTAFLCLKDRRAGIRELVCVRNISSWKLIFTRFLAVITAVMFPTIILAYISNSSVWGLYEGMALDYLAPLTYALGWLLPSVLVSAAVGMFFSELTATPVAIAIQGIWWFVDLNAGSARMHGSYALFQLSPRHNALGNTQVFVDGFPVLAANRLFFTGMALVLVIASVMVYEQKRRGNFSGTRKSKKSVAALADRNS